MKKCMTTCINDTVIKKFPLGFLALLIADLSRKTNISNSDRQDIFTDSMDQ